MLEVVSSRSIERDCDHVEAEPHRPRREALAIELGGGADDALALAIVDAGERRLERARTSQSDLDDDDEVVSRRHEIELEPTDPDVLPFDDETACAEELGSELFSASSGFGLAQLAVPQLPDARSQSVLQAVARSYLVPLLTQYAPVRPVSPTPIELTSCVHSNPSGQVQ